MFLSSLEKQTPAGLIRLCLQYPLLSFDDPSHHLFLFSQSHFRTHTRILHILIFWMDLCFSLSSPSLTSPFPPPNISCFSPSFLVPISVFLATFKFSLSLCFVGLHFLIIISALVTKVQLYFQVLGLCSFGFGKLIKNCPGLKQSLFLLFWNRW